VDRQCGAADWNPVYYNRADAGGIGFERGPKGSNAVGQYAPPLAAQYADPATTPERLLLWFHHVPWTYQMKSGRTLWDELVLHYARGVDEVGAMNATWARMKPHVDPERFQITADFLHIQEQDAQIWRDASIAYFQSLSALRCRPASRAVAYARLLQGVESAIRAGLTRQDGSPVPQRLNRGRAIAAGGRPHLPSAYVPARGLLHQTERRC